MEPIRVRVKEKDHQYKMWEPFDGVLLGFCMGGDGRPYAVVCDIENEQTHLVSIHIITYIESNPYPTPTEPEREKHD